MRIKDVVTGENFMEGYYESSSKGMIKIKDMSTQHIKNAILKLDKTIIYNTIDGVMHSHGKGYELPVYKELVQEYSTRPERVNLYRTFITKKQYEQQKLDS